MIVIGIILILIMISIADSLINIRKELEKNRIENREIINVLKNAKIK